MVLAADCMVFEIFFGRGLSSCTHEAYFLAQTSANWNVTPAHSMHQEIWISFVLSLI